MKAFTTVLSVAEIHAARAFYEDLFGLELYQDYRQESRPLPAGSPFSRTSTG